jgi:hypothetical protein
MMDQFKSEPDGIPVPDLGLAERNRALAIRWFLDVWNERRDQTLDELFATNGIELTFKIAVNVEA